MEITPFGGTDEHSVNNLFGMDSIQYLFLDRIYRIDRIFFLQRFPEESAETQSA